MDYLLKIQCARYLADYKIYCLFSNGIEKIVDLKDKLHGEMFEPLKDKNTFMQFRVDEVLKTVIWPNGADLAPYSLYEIGKPIGKKRKAKKVKREE